MTAPAVIPDAPAEAPPAVPARRARPVEHETTYSELVDEPANPRVCHLLGANHRPMCGANGLGLSPHVVKGDPRASPCAGGCGRARCASCALAYTG
jgi:hypothetical protein